MSSFVVRRAVGADYDAARLVVAEDLGRLRAQFGDFDLRRLLETAFLSIAVCTAEGALTGLAVFEEEPAAGVLGEREPLGARKRAPRHDAKRELGHFAARSRACAVLRDGYGVERASAGATLWLRLWTGVGEAARGNGAKEALGAVLRAVLVTLPHIDVLAVALSPSSPHIAPLFPSFFTPLPPSSPPSSSSSAASSPWVSIGCWSGEEPVVGVCERFGVLPRLRVRRAALEDFDDLVPVFERRSEVTRGTFGEYFLADVVEAADRSVDRVLREDAGVGGAGKGATDGKSGEEDEFEDDDEPLRVALVGVDEGSGKAVGLVAATTDVHLRALEDKFRVELVGGLREETEAQLTYDREKERGSARRRRDWLSTLEDHAAELEALFDVAARRSAVESGGEWGGIVLEQVEAGAGKTREAHSTLLSSLSRVFDARGKSWGFQGPLGEELGQALLTAVLSPRCTPRVGAEGTEAEAHDDEILVAQEAKTLASLSTTSPPSTIQAILSESLSRAIRPPLALPLSTSTTTPPSTLAPSSSTTSSLPPPLATPTPPTSTSSTTLPLLSWEKEAEGEGEAGKGGGGEGGGSGGGGGEGEGKGRGLTRESLNEAVANIATARERRRRRRRLADLWIHGLQIASRSRREEYGGEEGEEVEDGGSGGGGGFPSSSSSSSSSSTASPSFPSSSSSSSRSSAMLELAQFAAAIEAAAAFEAAAVAGEPMPGEAPEVGSAPSNVVREALLEEFRALEAARETARRSAAREEAMQQARRVLRQRRRAEDPYADELGLEDSQFDDEDEEEEWGGGGGGGLGGGSGSGSGGWEEDGEVGGEGGEGRAIFAAAQQQANAAVAAMGPVTVPIAELAAAIDTRAEAEQWLWPAGGNGPGTDLLRELEDALLEAAQRGEVGGRGWVEEEEEEGEEEEEVGGGDGEGEGSVGEQGSKDTLPTEGETMVATGLAEPTEESLPSGRGMDEVGIDDMGEDEDSMEMEEEAETTASRLRLALELWDVAVAREAPVRVVVTTNPPNNTPPPPVAPPFEKGSGRGSGEEGKEEEEGGEGGGGGGGGGWWDVVCGVGGKISDAELRVARLAASALSVPLLSIPDILAAADLAARQKAAEERERREKEAEKKRIEEEKKRKKSKGRKKKEGEEEGKEDSGKGEKKGKAVDGKGEGEGKGEGGGEEEIEVADVEDGVPGRFAPVARRLLDADCASGYVLVGLPVAIAPMLELRLALRAAGVEPGLCLAASVCCPRLGEAAPLCPPAASVLAPVTWVRGEEKGGVGVVVSPEEEDDGDVCAALVLEGAMSERADAEFHTRPTLAVAEQRALETHPGYPTCVSVSLFCVEQEFESRSVDFLPALFEAFDALGVIADWVLLTTPHAAIPPPFAQHMVHIPPRPGTAPDQALFACHRSSLHIAQSLTASPLTSQAQLPLLHNTLFHTLRRNGAVPRAMRTGILAEAAAAIESGAEEGEEGEEDGGDLVELAKVAKRSVEDVCVGERRPGVVFLHSGDGECVGVAVVSEEMLGGAELAAVRNSFDVDSVLDVELHGGAAGCTALSFFALHPRFHIAAVIRAALSAVLEVRGSRRVLLVRHEEALPSENRTILHALHAGAFHPPPSSSSSPVSSCVVTAARGPGPEWEQGGGCGFDAALGELIRVPPRLLAQLTPAQRAAEDREVEEAREDAALDTGSAMEGPVACAAADAAEARWRARNPRSLRHPLLVQCRRLLSEPRLGTSARVVVVGASDCGLSVLAGLRAVPYAHLRQLTLVTPGGLNVPSAGEEDGASEDREVLPWAGVKVPLEDVLLSDGGSAAERAESKAVARAISALDDPERVPASFLPRAQVGLAERQRLGLIAGAPGLQVVDGSLAHINRGETHLLTDVGEVVPFDLLVLCPGLTEGTIGRIQLPDAPAKWPRGLHAAASPRTLGALEADVDTLLQLMPNGDIAKRRRTFMERTSKACAEAAELVLQAASAGSTVTALAQERAAMLAAEEQAQNQTQAPPATAASTATAGHALRPPPTAASTSTPAHTPGTAVAPPTPIGPTGTAGTGGRPATAGEESSVDNDPVSALVAAIPGLDDASAALAALVGGALTALADAAATSARGVESGDSRLAGESRLSAAESAGTGGDADGAGQALVEALADEDDLVAGPAAALRVPMPILERAMAIDPAAMVGDEAGRDVLVCGSALEALASISALIDRGISPRRIALAHRGWGVPRPSRATTTPATSSASGGRKKPSRIAVASALPTPTVKVVPRSVADAVGHGVLEMLCDAASPELLPPEDRNIMLREDEDREEEEEAGEGKEEEGEGGGEGGGGGEGEEGKEEERREGGEYVHPYEAEASARRTLRALGVLQLPGWVLMDVKEVLAEESSNGSGGVGGAGGVGEEGVEGDEEVVEGDLQAQRRGMDSRTMLEVTLDSALPAGLGAAALLREGQRAARRMGELDGEDEDVGDVRRGSGEFGEDGEEEGFKVAELTMVTPDLTMDALEHGLVEDGEENASSSRSMTAVSLLANALPRGDEEDSEDEDELLGAADGLEDEEDEEERRRRHALASDLRRAATARAAARRMTARVRLVVCADERDVDPVFFRAVNGSGLVYDGRLVVDHHFATADASVLAGGSVCRFSRRYRAERTLEAYDSREIGSALAASVLHRVDDMLGLEADAGMAEEEEMRMLEGQWSALLPDFGAPKVAIAVLPGGFRFFRASLPAWNPWIGTKAAIADAESAKATRKRLGGGEEEGEKLAVWDPKKGVVETRAYGATGDGDPERHCRLELDRFGRVARISVLSHRHVESLNLTRLVGLHVAWLRNLTRDVAAGRVEDLVSHFRDEWVSALTHDCAPDELIAAVRDEIERAAEQAARGEVPTAALEHGGGPFPSDIAETVADAVREVQETIREYNQTKEGEDPVARVLAETVQRVGVAGSGLAAESRAQLEQRVLAFLKAHRELLKGFFLPGIHKHPDPKVGDGLAPTDITF